MDKCIVEIQYGAYKGKETVFCDEDTDNDTIKAKALKQAGANFLPMAYTSVKIIRREFF